MVFSSVSGLGLAGRYDPYTVVPDREGDGDQAVLDHADGGVSLLAVVLPPVDLLEHGKILKRVARRIECDAMFGVVQARLVVVPLK
jgi:hypothetical protein